MRKGRPSRTGEGGNAEEEMGRELRRDDRRC